MSRLAYFVRETLISLRRNLMMTVAGIITVAISLFLFGGITLVWVTVGHGAERWKHGVELEIFMKSNPAAPQKQVDDVMNSLKANTAEVKSVRFLNHQDAYAEFKKEFADQPALVESTTPDALPVSFRVTPVRAELTEVLRNEYKDMPGVDTIVTAQQQVKRLLEITRLVRWFFWFISAALVVSSGFLIVNTIRLATFARRREIEVMKLVGASNWFVRVPFMAEGLVQGVIGAGFAVGGVWGLKILIGNWLDSSHNLLQTFRVTNADAVRIGVLLIVIGATIGTVGSAIGLRRFLEA